MLKAKLLGATAGAEVAPAIEDVFSTYLYTGNGSTQTITNGIDLAGEGGLWWGKQRNSTGRHWLLDNARGGNIISTNLADAQLSAFASSPFTSTGISFTSSNSIYNASGSTYASWTFRQAPRFFDVVTYTGTGANRTIAHDLGVVPGCIIVKRRDTTGDWQVYHRSLANTEYTVLNSTAAKATGATRWNSTTPTSSVFSLGTDATVNASGSTYVAYVFAHDPLGPSGDGSDGLIACGSCLGTSSVNLGWEPQFVLVKATTVSEDWFLFDTMRGLTASVSGTTETGAYLLPNSLAAEASFSNGLCSITATGFNLDISTAATYTYIAIRRGPMREPTVGTEVFAMDTYRATSPALVSGFVTDWTFRRLKNTTADWTVSSRLTGKTTLLFNSTAAEASGTTELYDYQNGAISSVGSAFSTLAGWMFRRAPGFFDVVAHTGTGSAIARNHNLTVLPELIITKARTNVGGQMNWYVGHYGLNQYATSISTNPVNNTSLSTFAPVTTTTFVPLLNTNTGTFISYLFASLPGISKVGSYTGNGSSQTINCAFTTGARFVLIKRADSTGDWYVWDTALGIVTGNDPHLSLNTTAAEVTSDDTIDPDNSGFIVNQVAATNVNVNAATYIFLAIA